MLKRLLIFLAGHLRIEVIGDRLERFLNLGLAEGIYLWQIERLSDRMRASITISDFRALRPVARGSRCRVRLLARHGFPFVAARARRRPVLLAGAVACLAFILWATGHVWFVKVKITGPQNLDPRAIEAVAAEAGLRQGALKRGVDLKQVAEHIQERMGEITWAGVRIQGTRAIIEVVEKAARRSPRGLDCVNLVAKKDGVVEQVVPFLGEPVVKKGSIVKAGDLLVECAFKYWEGGRPAVLPGTPPPPREGVARTLVAQALVRAWTSYSEYREIPLIQEIEAPTGRTATQWVLKWGGKPIILNGKERNPFERYQEHRRTYGQFSWRNWKSPVELVILNAKEVRVVKEQISPEAAIAQAKEQMQSQLRWRLGPSDQAGSIQAEVVEQKAEYIGVRVWVETLEEIATPKPGQPVPVPQQAPGAQPTQP